MIVNQLKDIRLGSTFEKFEFVDDEIEKIKNQLFELSNLVRNKLKNGEIFKKGKIISLYGDVGTGKTHLLEAFLNSLSDFKDDIFFFRKEMYNFSFFNDIKELKNKKVIVIDDVFQKYNSISDIENRDVQGLFNLIKYVYNNKILLLLSSNFEVDNFQAYSYKEDVDRVRSRCDEIFYKKHVVAPDFRKKIKKNRNMLDL